MKKSILLPIIAISAVGITGISAFASQENTSTSFQKTGNNNQKNDQIFGKRGENFGMKQTFMELTDSEKQTIESLSDSEKQAFFHQKRTEIESQMTIKESVIDKLLAGEALSAEEEQVRQSIILERAKRKTEQEAMKANMTKIQAIQEKKQAGTELTTEEQAILDTLPNHAKGQKKSDFIKQPTKTTSPEKTSE